jgi:hypothetical protein
MKKLLIAAAAVAVLPAFLAQAQAAAQKDPMCKLGAAGNQSFAEHYGCWGKPARAWAPTAAAAPMMHHHHHHHHHKA